MKPSDAGKARISLYVQLPFYLALVVLTVLLFLAPLRGMFYGGIPDFIRLAFMVDFVLFVIVIVWTFHLLKLWRTTGRPGKTDSDSK